MIPCDFHKANVIIHKLIEQGFEAYFVGGAVRDMLINRKIGDIDIATSARPEEVMSLFPQTVPVGLQHGTVVVVLNKEHFEVTTFREDVDYVDYRRPKGVNFITSLNEDLRRRDFTMNAIAMDIDGNLFDPFRGKTAIERKYIQTVGNPNERFNEDALRMLRAIRFHGQLSFSIEKETLHGITHLAHLLKHISIERITNEFEKIIMSPSCHTAIHHLVKTKLHNYILDLATYEKQLLSWKKIDTNAMQSRSEIWAFVCYKLNVQNCEEFLAQWKLPTKVVKEAVTIIQTLYEIDRNGWSNPVLYNIGLQLALSSSRLFSIIHETDFQSELRKCETEYKQLPIKKRSELLINGNELIEWSKKQPGPWVSDILAQTEKAILTGVLSNDKESIKEWLYSCNLL
jgi:tRNA nucleotidyltransferase (CCA-adding enzyme)